MTAYLDASVLVSMFVADLNTPRAWRLAERRPSCIASLWTITEFSSALHLRARIGALTSEECSRAESSRLDHWLTSGREPVAMLAEDFLAARRMLRERKLNLRAPDALHLAACSRLGAELSSFDVKMLAAAAALGIPAVEV